jgi:hypothetical protein
MSALLAADERFANQETHYMEELLPNARAEKVRSWQRDLYARLTPVL